eukprot:9231761-Prorocentrum_lima.AAC.1
MNVFRTPSLLLNTPAGSVNDPSNTHLTSHPGVGVSSLMPYDALFTPEQIQTMKDQWAQQHRLPALVDPDNVDNF